MILIDALYRCDEVIPRGVNGNISEILVKVRQVTQDRKRTYNRNGETLRMDPTEPWREFKPGEFYRMKWEAA
jgi:hypothetical protein